MTRPPRIEARLVTSWLLGAVSASASIGLAATAAWLISRAAEQPHLATLAVAIVGVRFFGVARGLARYAERLSGHDASFRVLAQERVSFFRQLERLAPSGLPAFRSGDLLARLVDDVERVQDLVLRVLPPYVTALLVGGAAVTLLFVLQPAAGLLLLAGLLVSATLIPAWSNRRVRRLEAHQAETRGAVSVEVLDLLRGASELVASGADRGQLARIEAVDRRLTSEARTAAGTSGVGEGLTTLVGGLVVLGCVVAGTGAVADGRLSSTLLAVVVLTPLAAVELMTALPTAAATYERVRQSERRLLAVRDAPDPVREPEHPREVPAGPYHVTVSGVRARYAEDGPWALDGVDLVLAPGRPVAMVGRSGAGKSTLAALLVRFLDPVGGVVALNGVPLSAMSGDAVRRVIGQCQQGAHVFDTTLAKNLLLGAPTASRQQLRDVLATVGLLDWVDGLPDGLDTQVGEAGGRLSGGQRQRLVLARALLADFPVLVLDEPTEHLETAAADALMATVLGTRTNRATLVITHRLTGLEAVHEVVVLEQGRVTERGTHHDLVHAGGRYAARWALEQDLAEGLPEAHQAVAARSHPRGMTRPRDVAATLESPWGYPVEG